MCIGRRAIRKGIKIQLEWNEDGLPCGDHRTTFGSFIGVVARERVPISYEKWPDLPEELVNEVYNMIVKGFTVVDGRKDMILGRASMRWKAFKSRLRKKWLYTSKKLVREESPRKYPFIFQHDWDKFVIYSTSPKFQKMSEANRDKAKLNKSKYRGGRNGYIYYKEKIVAAAEKQGFHLTKVPRHLTWLKAHQTLDKQSKEVTFSPADLEIAQAIKTVEDQVQTGEVVCKGRDDVLAKAFKNPEHGGRVRGVGGGITNKEYFGFNKPPTRTQLQDQVNGLQATVSFIMSCISSSSQLIPEHMRNMTAHFGNLGGHVSGFETRAPTVNNFVDMGRQESLDDVGRINLSNQNATFGPTYASSVGHNSGRQQPGISAMESGGFAQLGNRSNGDVSNVACDVEPYHVKWPDTDNQPQCHSNYEPIINHHTFPEGESDCQLAIEEDNEIRVVAIGKVIVPRETQVMLNHGHPLLNGQHRVTVTEDIEPAAPIPCPTDEASYVCQVKNTYVAWPAYLILPITEVDTNNLSKQPTNPTTSPSLQVPSSLHMPSPQSPCSQSTKDKGYSINLKDKARLTTEWVKFLRQEALKMKKNDDKYLIEIPHEVFNNSQDLSINYMHLLDWCYQKCISVTHMSIFMRYLSETCHGDGISGLYGFCDANMLSQLSHVEKSEDRSDYLACVFACNNAKNRNQLFFCTL